MQHIDVAGSCGAVVARGSGRQQVQRWTGYIFVLADLELRMIAEEGAHAVADDVDAAGVEQGRITDERSLLIVAEEGAHAVADDIDAAGAEREAESTRGASKREAGSTRGASKREYSIASR